MQQPAIMINEQRVIDNVKQLVKLANQICWNNISDNYLFIISEINNATISFVDQRKLSQVANDSKTHLTLSEVTDKLNQIYNELYDVNFYVYRAEKAKTLIQVKYYRKSSLDVDYYEIVKNKEPMMHCKIAQPAYNSIDKGKFDLNWQHNALAHRLKMYWFRLRYYFNGIN